MFLKQPIPSISFRSTGPMQSHKFTAPNQRFLSFAFVGLVITFILLSRAHHASPKSLVNSFRPSHTTDLLDEIHNSTLGFQKIFIITLPSRTDQRDGLTLAARLTGLDIEFVDGVTEVEEKSLPPGAIKANIKESAQGAWRAHMNVMQRIVAQNLTSALVLEGDVDWDIRIKQQMRNFAKASRLIVQPLPGEPKRHLDPTFPRPKENDNPTNFVLEEHVTTLPTTSPYGDLKNWDLLWLGHCGARFPRVFDEKIPLGRVLMFDDETVPEPHHIKTEFGDDELKETYPPHTRAVSRASMNICSLGYAVTQTGAQKVLYSLGVDKLTAPIDVMLRSLCDGRDGRDIATCLTVQPQLFQHHRPRGRRVGFSDINNYGGFNEVGATDNIRWSARLNIPKMINGRTDYTDQWKDGKPKS